VKLAVKRAPLAAVIVIWLACQAAWAQSAGEQIIAALERYRVAVLELDIDREIASFTEDAQFSQGSEPAVQGRTTIRALLQSQAGFKVVGYELRTTATRVQGQLAIQNGFFGQRTISPQHESKIVKGVFEIEWSRQADGTWLISRLRTDPVEDEPRRP
jgi:ketosteroid isomerase-like protein